MVGSEPNKPKGYRRRRIPLLKWHRSLGIAAAFFAAVLAVTGILLNHNAALGLQQKQITQAWLLDHYDINSVPEDEFSYPETLTLDRVILDIHTGRFFGDAGRIVMDIVALAMLLLSLTGVCLWFGRRKQSQADAK